MSVRRKLAEITLDKFIVSNRNLSKPSPKLWPNDHRHHPFTDFDYRGLPELTLNHPILQKLESCNKATEFNQIHAQLTVSGLLQHSFASSRVIKKLCTSLNLVSVAVTVFGCIKEPDAFLCNTIMRCYLNSNDPYGALSFYYEKMVAKCVLPNHYTFPLLGKVCAEVGSLRDGEKAHALVVKHGFSSDLFVRNSLIHMYSVCRQIGSAREVFDDGSVLDMVSWNSMIDGYVKNGEVEIARELFDQMPERDIFSWNSMIAGYAGTGDMERARELFEITPFHDVVSWNCMIDGYAQVGNITSARELFERMVMRNVVSWNTMFALYVRQKDYGKCLELFDRMIIEQESSRPNDASLVSVLTACANLGRLDKGKWVHSYMETNNIKLDVLLSTSLLSMYAKCGEMDLARDVFDQMPTRSVVSWNSMIMGYGIHGHGEKSLEMFLEMEKSGVKPNDSTFVSVLSACTHSGMVLEGWWCFDLMCRVYEIEPKVEHYGCMVDLLGRAGLTRESEELIQKMPMEAGTPLWGALLSACRTHSNSELGKIVANRLIELDPSDSGPYVLLSNIYAAEGKWDDVENVRKMMKEKRLGKFVGSSLVDTKENSWLSESNKCHRRRVLYSMLSKIGAQIKLCQDDYFAE
ncbi:pentatricopeptide repeat-containing protein At4g18840-like [Rutidosis leptorrhynchoides]|uniref:pentatricopeptide repeat-containing protein At4g18840-like n=1 Tax=Rutidosis leptorrhynchoides TaxID=125765 RepID=UPI003A98D36A